MRRAVLTFLLALLAVPAFAGSDEFDIRLGSEPPKPKSVDPATVASVEKFLGARQLGSRDAKQRGAARAMLAGKADDAELFGPSGATLAAHDFHDRSIEPEGKGSFRVSVYLLFANKDGAVVESRDETLTFAARKGGYVCTGLKAAGSMTWDERGVAETADRLKAGEALARAENALHAWAKRHEGVATYSIADIQEAGDGRYRVQCLRFTASRGRRGFDAQDSTLILVRDGEGFRVDSN